MNLGNSQEDIVNEQTQALSKLENNSQHIYIYIYENTEPIYQTNKNWKQSVTDPIQNYRIKNNKKVSTILLKF